MPRYFFDVRGGECVVRDDDGVVLSSIEEATKEAAAALADLASDMLPGDPVRDIAIEVRNGAGPEPLLRAAVAHLLASAPRPRCAATLVAHRVSRPANRA